MNLHRSTHSWLSTPRRAALPVLFTSLFAAIVVSSLPIRLLPTARACLTGEITPRAVQWSTAVVAAKLSNLGDKSDLPAPARAPTTRPSGKPVAVAYRVVTFTVTETIDGSLQTGDAVHVVVLIGGRPGDGACPALLPESVGKNFILLLRPFEQTRLDVPDGTYIAAGHGAMVIVSQLGHADINSDTIPDLKTFVAKTRDAAAAVKDDQILPQADAVASAQDQTEADHAEKAIGEIGPAALPALQDKLKVANDAGKTRLKRLIDDLSPPALSAEPE